MCLCVHKYTRDAIYVWILKFQWDSSQALAWKFKTVAFSPNTPCWLHGEEEKGFSRPPAVLVTAPSLYTIFSTISREITEQHRQLPDSHSCIVCASIFVLWLVWQVCKILWQCLRRICEWVGEAECVCVCQHGTKFYKAQLNKDSLLTNLFDTTLKICLSLCHTSTVGKDTKLQQHQASRKQWMQYDKTVFYCEVWKKKSWL